MVKRNFRTILLLAWFSGSLLFSQKSGAAVSLNLSAGYAPYGQLQSEETVQVKLLPVIGSFDVLWKFSDSNQMNFGLGAHYSSIWMRKGGSNYAGIFSAFSLGLSFSHFYNQNFQIQFGGEALFLGTLNLKAITATTVNGQEFKESVFISHKGTLGTLFRLAFIRNSVFGKFSKNQYMRFGVAIDYLIQPFTSHSTDITATDSSILPKQTTESSSASQLSYASIAFLIGFVF